jgi:hypothetical protein
MEANDKAKKGYLNELDLMRRLNSPHIIAFDYQF